MDSASAMTSILRCCACHRVHTSEPMWKSRNEQNRNTDNTPRPNKNEPWQFTHTANIGGSKRNKRGWRVRPRCTISSSHVNSKYPMRWGRIARPTVAKSQVANAPSSATFALPEYNELNVYAEMMSNEGTTHNHVI